MAWVLYILTASSSVMLWRDLKSGRIYYVYNPVRLEYDAPEYFLERIRVPIMYRFILITVGILCLSNLILGTLFFLGLTWKLNTEFLGLLLIPGIIVTGLYLMYGIAGRLCSWVKNYGSIDKQW